MSEDQTSQDQAAEATPEVDVVQDENVVAFPAKFRFQSVKNKESGEETKRAPVELELHSPSLKGIAAILKSGNEALQKLLVEALQDVIIAAARDQVVSNENLTAETFDHTKVSFEYIATTPKERSGRGISKESWEDFYGDYTAVFTTLIPEKDEQGEVKGKNIGEANCQVWKSRCQTIRGKTPQLKRMQDRLAMYVSSTKKLDDFSSHVEYLNNKLTEFINEGQAYGLDKL